MSKGLFITFEGPEGSGKTTHIELLAAHMRSQNYRVLVTREPGGTKASSKIRELLLETEESLSPLAELFLYEADRAHHVQRMLLPALNKGMIILCDRYTDSTLAYQGYGRGLHMATIESLNAAASDHLKPYLTILLDVPARRGLHLALRKKNRHDRLEKAGLAFHNRVRQGFLALARKEPRRFRVIKQQKTIEETQMKIREMIDNTLMSLRVKRSNLS